MVYRPVVPNGAPCWVDLWTSDVEGSRHFYCDLFGWQAGEPSSDHGGYFMFTRAGAPVAGAMGDMGDTPADDTWKPYFASENVERTLELAVARRAEVRQAGTAIGDLGHQAVIVDPAGAVTGIWQPGTFPGFTVIYEDATPSFIAIDVCDYDAEIAFYRQVFGWHPLEEEVDGHHYAGYMDPVSNRPIAGIGDEAESLAPGESPQWSVFWQSDDVDASVAKLRAIGGSVIIEPADGGLGRVARVADPSGARFCIFEPKG
ncbi:MAG: VOC family protein [Actinomycetota bacterium]|nr:VOC family protein [Actinomycetota bacterium]MDA8357884.1 VOC family protein [Actinomycetota bacterium]